MCRALSYGTANSSFMQAMTSTLRDAQQTGKKLPTTWQEMDADFGRPTDEAFPYIIPSRRYVFIQDDVRFENERILLMTRSPFRDASLYTTWYGGIAHGLREPGRWMIVEDGKSLIHLRYVQEELLVSAFASASVALPTPDGLGKWPHEVEFEKRTHFEILVGCVVLGVALLIFLADQVRRRVISRQHAQS